MDITGLKNNFIQDGNIIKYRVHYRGMPAYIDLEARMITGRNFWWNILIQPAIVIDQAFAILRGDKHPKVPVTVDETDDD